MRRALLLLAILALPGWAAAQSVGVGGGFGLHYTPPAPVKGASGWTFDGPIILPAGGGTGTTGVSGLLCVGAALVTTTGTAEQTLATCTVPANTLNANSMTLRVTASGLTAANGNTKVIRARWGGIAGNACAAVSTSGSGVGWRLVSEITRLGDATHQWCIGAGTAATSTGLTISAPTLDLTAANTIVITITTATQAGDASLYHYMVELLR